MRLAAVEVATGAAVVCSSKRAAAPFLLGLDHSLVGRGVHKKQTRGTISTVKVGAEPEAEAEAEAATTKGAVGEEGEGRGTMVAPVMVVANHSTDDSKEESSSSLESASSARRRREAAAAAAAQQAPLLTTPGAIDDDKETIATTLVAACRAHFLVSPEAFFGYIDRPESGGVGGGAAGN
jgi:hypothetical protein